MQLTHLALSNFRNYAQLDFEPASGLNLLLGANAQGKSNILEAIAMLATGKSFRTKHDLDVVREGMELAVVRGKATVHVGSINLSATIAKTPRGARKQYAINGRNVRYAKFLGSVRVVTFVPTDLHLVGGPPSLRRAFLNLALAQEEPQYYHDLARYHKSVAQKSALLRGAVAHDPELYAIYERSMIETGTRVMLARNHFLSAIAREAQNVHAGWTHGREVLHVGYRPNVAIEVPTADAIAGAFAARLREAAAAERLRKTTLVGPHRDDLSLELNGLDLAAYGSQGQQRTAVLALKVAEYSVMRNRDGEAPLLLLDDVLSELDEARARAFLAGVGSYQQAFVTATHRPPSVPTEVRTFHIAQAQITDELAC